jgi:hypothetical protein
LLHYLILQKFIYRCRAGFAEPTADITIECGNSRNGSTSAVYANRLSKDTWYVLLKGSASKSVVLLELPLLQLTLGRQMASAAEAAFYQLISWYTFCLH